MAGQEVITLSMETFDTEVLSHKGVALVDFWAPWCNPCRMVAPIVDELAGELSGSVKVGKLNVDDYGALAAQYGVMSIPTLLVFKDGAEVERIVGVRPKSALLSTLQGHLS